MKRMFSTARSLSFAVLLIAGIVLVSPARAQDYVLLTKGGGVTGNATVFRLSSTGEVAKGRGAPEPQFFIFAQLGKGKTRKYFRKTRSLLKEQSFNHPGNMYTALALVEADRESKIVWGDAAHEAPKRALKLYQDIQDSLDGLTFREDLRK